MVDMLTLTLGAVFHAGGRGWEEGRNGHSGVMWHDLIYVERGAVTVSLLEPVRDDLLPPGRVARVPRHRRNSQRWR